MDDFIDSTQRWWAMTTRTSFLFGRALHVSDSNTPRDWSVMYRWHLVKQASIPTLMVGAGLAIVTLVLWLPGAAVMGESVLKPLLTAVASLALAAGIALTALARRKPFSVITLPVADPTLLVDELEELWPKQSPGQREDLRQEFLRTYESQRNWSPQTLQRALVTRAERHRALLQRSS